MNLNDDVLNLILSFTQNPECVIVCKIWYNIIIKNSSKCLKCKKIIKMYDYVIWKTDKGDDLCHMHALHKDTYTVANVVITNILPLKNLFEKILMFAPKMPTYMNFISLFGDNSIFIRAKDESCEFIDENYDTKYFNKFIVKNTEAVANINVLKLYNFINSFNNDETFLFRINNKRQLGVKVQSSKDKYIIIYETEESIKCRPTFCIFDMSSNFIYDCMFEISLNDFKRTCNTFKTNTKNIEIECFTDKIIFTSKETNMQSIYESCSGSDHICMFCDNKIISISRNKEEFDDSKTICGTFKFENMKNIKPDYGINLIDTIEINNNVNLIGNIRILINHNMAIAFVYSNSQNGGWKYIYLTK